MNTSAIQSFHGSRSHATTEDRLAVSETPHNGSVAMRAVVVTVVTGAFTFGVSCESVGPPFFASDFAIDDVENQEIWAAPKMRGYIGAIR